MQRCVVRTPLVSPPRRCIATRPSRKLGFITRAATNTVQLGRDTYERLTSAQPIYLVSTQEQVKVTDLWGENETVVLAFGRSMGEFSFLYYLERLIRTVDRSGTLKKYTCPCCVQGDHSVGNWPNNLKEMYGLFSMLKTSKCTSFP